MSCTPSTCANFGMHFRVFDRHGFFMHIRRFRGRYKRLDYPQAYSADERRLIASFMDSTSIRLMLTNPSSAGRLSYAGMFYLCVDNEGNVARSPESQVYGEYGNIVEKTARLDLEPQPLPPGVHEGSVDGTAMLFDSDLDELTGNHIWSYATQGGVQRENGSIHYPYREVDFSDPRVMWDLGYGSVALTVGGDGRPAVDDAEVYVTTRPSFPQRALGRIGRSLRGIGSMLSQRSRKLRREELMGRLAELHQGLLREFQFEDRDLSRLALNGLVAERLTFIRCRFRGTDLDNSELRDIRLIDCDCRGVSAVGASWANVTIEGCDFSEADLSNISLSGSCPGIRLQGSLLTNARVDRVNLYGAVLTGADLRDASFVGAVLEEAECSQANFFNTTCRDAKAAGAVFENAVCLGVDFRNAALDGASFDGCQARVADFRSAVLTGSSFRKADLGESDFTGAETGGAVFDEARTWNVQGLDSGPDRAAR